MDGVSEEVRVDEAFWRAFWSGPPVAGLFAVLAAAIAFYPAHRAAAVTKANSAREQWWNRAKWALELAGSGKESDREIAKDALIALRREATELESNMIILVISNMQDGDG